LQDKQRVALKVDSMVALKGNVLVATTVVQMEIRMVGY
jgi:hypothetical protein